MMKKKRWWILSLFIQMLPWFTIEAAILKNETQTVKLIPDAHWIKNHWIKDPSAETMPISWRTNKSIDLNSSGSVPLNLAQFNWLANHYGKDYRIYIIDLRQETHVYIDGLPISIFYKKDEINWGKNSLEIKELEDKWVSKINHNKSIILYTQGIPRLNIKTTTNPVKVGVNQASSEEKLVTNMGLQYLRIPVPDYHPPSPAQVDQFLNFKKNLPANAWLHFHCAGGKGRTTTFMLLNDIIENASNYSLKYLVERQSRLGGINIAIPSKSLLTQPWKDEYHKARIDFIELFYHFIHSGDVADQSFSQWMKKQPKGPYQLILKTKAYAHQL